MAQVDGSGTAPGTVRVKLPILSPLDVSLTVNVRVGLTNENGPKPRADRDVSGRNSELGGDALPSPLVAFVGKICSVTAPIVSRSEPNVVLPFGKKLPTGSLPAVTTTPAALVQNVPPGCKQGVPLAVKLRVSAAVSVPENVKEVPVAVSESTVSGLAKETNAASAGSIDTRVIRDTAATAAEKTDRFIVQLSEYVKNVFVKLVAQACFRAPRGGLIICFEKSKLKRSSDESNHDFGAPVLKLIHRGESQSFAPPALVAQSARVCITELVGRGNSEAIASRSLFAVDL
jgi:hypothetical protein